MRNHKIIPIVKAETLIPSGPYCYTPVEGPCAENGWVFRIKLCPFWQYREDIAELHGEQTAGYCSYLRKGDWAEDGTFLLWDQCKECGVKLEEEEDASCR